MPSFSVFTIVRPPHLLHAFYPASASKPETYNLNHEPRAVRNQAISKGGLEQITAWGMRRGKPHLTDDLRLSCLTKIVRNSFANEQKEEIRALYPHLNVHCRQSFADGTHARVSSFVQFCASCALGNIKLKRLKTCSDDLPKAFGKNSGRTAFWNFR